MAEPVKEPLAAATARWKHNRVLTPKDPDQVAVYLDEVFDDLIAQFNLIRKWEKQRQALDDLRAYLRFLVHNDDSETPNGLIIAGAGGMGKTWFIRNTLEAELVERREHRVYWESHNCMRHHHMMIVLAGFNAARDITVFNDAERIFEDFAVIKVLKAAMETEEMWIITYRPRPTKKEPSPKKAAIPFRGKIIVVMSDNIDRMAQMKQNFDRQIDGPVVCWFDGHERMIQRDMVTVIGGQAAQAKRRSHASSDRGGGRNHMQKVWQAPHDQR